jgi:excisionase family DNA binding protein
MRICQTNVYGLLKSGALRSVQIGARRLIPAEALVAYVESLKAGWEMDTAAPDDG